MKIVIFSKTPRKEEEIGNIGEKSFSCSKLLYMGSLNSVKTKYNKFGPDPLG